MWVDVLSVVTVEEGSVTLVGVETLSVVAVEEGPVTLVGVEVLSVVTMEVQALIGRLCRH